MSDRSHISWTDATWNPVAGCTRVNAQCDHCYAVKMTHRLGAMGHEKYAGLTVLNQRGDRHFNGEAREIFGVLTKPLRWRTPRRIFVNSMSDLFHERVSRDFRDLVFSVMALAPHHHFTILTKRPNETLDYFDSCGRDGLDWSVRMLQQADTKPTWTENESAWRERVEVWKKVAKRFAAVVRTKDAVRSPPLRWPLPNVEIGFSVGYQETLDAWMPKLLRVPARFRTLSLEPMLEAVTLRDWLEFGSKGPPWFCDDDEKDSFVGVYVGGESGPHARPMNPMWVRAIRDECFRERIPFHFKQWGEFDASGNWIGRKRAGRLLDGFEHNDVCGAIQLEVES